MTQWSTKETEIVLLMHGDNFEINTILQYESIKYKGLINEKADKKNMEGL